MGQMTQARTAAWQEAAGIEPATGDRAEKLRELSRLAYAGLIEDYSKLVDKWNRLVRQWNREVTPQPVGRPLDASEAQVREARKLRKKGRSLRGIVLDTGLTMATVRTITSKAKSTNKGRRKREMDRLRAAEYRARVRQSRMLAKQTPTLATALEQAVAAGKGLDA